MKICKTLISLVGLFLLFSVCAGAEENGKHLFILSGQSNMAMLNPDISFTPTVAAKFGKSNVIVVKVAQHGQPIRRWYKDWKDAEGKMPEKNGDIYNALLKQVNKAIKGKKISTVTFLWMQGERDAVEKHGAVYEQSLEGLVKQLSSDLKRDDIDVVVGRLSDFDMKNKTYKHWTMIRNIQVKLADSHENWAWVDTDSFNTVVSKKTGKETESLHYSEEGYKQFGARLAEEAIKLIQQRQKSAAQ